MNKKKKKRKIKDKEMKKKGERNLVLDPEVDFLQGIVLEDLDGHGVLLVVIERLHLQRQNVDFC